VSNAFYTNVHEALTGQQDAQQALENVERTLARLTR
jgi:ABC-type glycerol-3-phosphate transport system substrate-binding protein